jgi:cell division protein FtsL
MEPNVLGRAVIAVAVLVGSLGMVPWRQSRASEALAMLDDLHRQSSVAQAERVELQRDIQVLVSRHRVVPEARERLGMHTPEGEELVLLSGELTP